MLFSQAIRFSTGDESQQPQDIQDTPQIEIGTEILSTISDTESNLTEKLSESPSPLNLDDLAPEVKHATPADTMSNKKPKAKLITKLDFTLPPFPTFPPLSSFLPPAVQNLTKELDKTSNETLTKASEHLKSFFATIKSGIEEKGKIFKSYSEKLKEQAKLDSEKMKLKLEQAKTKFGELLSIFKNR